MRKMLLGLAAVAAALTTIGTGSAVAQDRSAGGWSGSSSRQGEWRGDRDGGDRDHRRHHRDGRGDVVAWGWSDGEWAYYNNRGFGSDSYNDWWHDRPDRAFPRWVHNNQGCERMWWSGGGWRC